MYIEFIDKKTGKLIENSKKMRQKYGEKQASKIYQRLTDIEACDNLAVLKTIPGKCHKLNADREGQYAIHLIEPYRLIFRPIYTDPVFKEENVRGILLLELCTDYH